MQSRNSAALDLDTTASVKAFRPCDSETPSKSRDPWRLSALVVDTYFSSEFLFGLAELSHNVGHQSYTRGETQFHQVQGVKCSSSFSYG